MMMLNKSLETPNKDIYGRLLRSSNSRSGAPSSVDSVMGRNGRGSHISSNDSRFSGPRSHCKGLRAKMWSQYQEHCGFGCQEVSSSEEQVSDDPDVCDKDGFRKHFKDNINTPVFSGDVVQYCKDAELWLTLTTVPESIRGVFPLQNSKEFYRKQISSQDPNKFRGKYGVGILIQWLKDRYFSMEHQEVGRRLEHFIHKFVPIHSDTHNTEACHTVALKLLSFIGWLT